MERFTYKQTSKRWFNVYEDDQLKFGVRVNNGYSVNKAIDVFDRVIHSNVILKGNNITYYIRYNLGIKDIVVFDA